MIGVSLAAALSAPKLKPFQFSKDIALGKKEKLYCTVLEGEGPFTFTWSKDGTAVENSALFRIQSIDEETSTLQIQAVRAEHVGNYTCSVRGALGSDSVTTALLLNGLTARGQ
ncbi:hypothetical protein LAZ67_1000064 [Cordylochernes scorpioides]|uniref:Ig-like domain-containing protein n=1 Tax=Cordylochernes scorpioides TaxID=51811 RepID=A0ABY6JUJ7_9ARAC|nr:hypothetical protein LAZ67_1000064 [Cordylochernes scorpioides]